MQHYEHAETDYNQYLTSVETNFMETSASPHPRFAERVIEVSRLLKVHLSDAEWLVETHGVHVPQKDRDIAIMVLEMELSVDQAKALYEAGYRFEPAHYEHNPDAEFIANSCF